VAKSVHNVDVTLVGQQIVIAIADSAVMISRWERCAGRTVRWGVRDIWYSSDKCWLQRLYVLCLLVFNDTFSTNRLYRVI